MDWNREHVVIRSCVECFDSEDIGVEIMGRIRLGEIDETGDRCDICNSSNATYIVEIHHPRYWKRRKRKGNPSMPSTIDWEGMTKYMGYSSVKEMIEKEIELINSHPRGGGVRKLAVGLGVSDVSLYNKMRELEIERPPRGKQRYDFFPERFGYPSEKAMMQCLRFDEKMTLNQIVKLLRSKITEHPVRYNTIKNRLTKYECFGGALTSKQEPSRRTKRKGLIF